MKAKADGSGWERGVQRFEGCKILWICSVLGVGVSAGRGGCGCVVLLEYGMGNRSRSHGSDLRAAVLFIFWYMQFIVLMHHEMFGFL